MNWKQKKFTKRSILMVMYICIALHIIDMLQISKVLTIKYKERKDIIFILYVSWWKLTRVLLIVFEH